MSINWFPGHMHKATKSIRAILPKIDMIIEVLDARIPYSSENPVIQQLKIDKPRLKVLNKSDLADPDMTQTWLNDYNARAHTQAKSLSLLQGDKAQLLLPLIEQMAAVKVDKAGYIHALILGIPNVGKSTIINSLAGRGIAKTGNEPAITKDLQKINLHNGIMLWDSPGILWPKVDNPNSGYRLAITGAIKDTAIRHDDIAFYAIEYLLLHYPNALVQRFSLPVDGVSALTFMESLGSERGCLVKGGHVDFDKVSKIILNEIRAGSLGRITFETPRMAAVETEQVEKLIREKQAAKEKKKEERKKSFKRQR